MTLQQPLSILSCRSSAAPVKTSIFKSQITLVVSFSVTTYTSMFKPRLHLTQMFKLKPHKTRTSVFKPQSHLTLQSSIHSYNLNIHDQTTVTPYTSMLMPKFLLTHQFQIFSHINIQTTVTSITSMIKSQSKIQAIVTHHILKFESQLHHYIHFQITVTSCTSMFNVQGYVSKNMPENI